MGTGNEMSLVRPLSRVWRSGFSSRPYERSMESPAFFDQLDQLDKKELVERCLQLQKMLEEEKTTTVASIEALTTLVPTDQDMEKSLTNGLQFILEALDMDGGYIHVIEQEEHVLRLRASLGLSGMTEEGLRIIREGEKIPGQVLQRAEPLLATNTTQISDLSGNVTQEEDRMLHAGFPLKWNERVLGTLTVTSKNQEAFNEENVSLLKAFSQFLAVIVQNLTLFDIVSEGKRQWEDAFDSMSDLVVICDRDFRIVKTNRAILERFWLPLEDAIGKECFELLYDGNPFPVSRENLESMLRQGVTYHEEVAPARQGGIFSIVVSPILSSGRLTGSVHVIKEITQEKLLEKDRQELVRRVSLLAPGTITIDPDGKIHSMDSGAREILGYKEEEIKGKPLSLLLPAPSFRTICEDLNETGGILDLDTVVMAAGDRPVRVSTTLSAHWDLKERLEEVTVFIRHTVNSLKARNRKAPSLV